MVWLWFINYNIGPTVSTNYVYQQCLSTTSINSVSSTFIITASIIGVCEDPTAPNEDYWNLDDKRIERIYLWDMGYVCYYDDMHR